MTTTYESRAEHVCDFSTNPELTKGEREVCIDPWELHVGTLAGQSNCKPLEMKIRHPCPWDGAYALRSTFGRYFKTASWSDKLRSGSDPQDWLPRNKPSETGIRY